MATKKADPADRLIAVLERIEAELQETNQRLGCVEARLEGVETQGKRTNKRLGSLEKRLTTVDRLQAVPPARRGIVALPGGAT